MQRLGVLRLGVGVKIGLARHQQGGQPHPEGILERRLDARRARIVRLLDGGLFFGRLFECRNTGLCGPIF